jgi:hypothetical protein
MEAGTIKTKSVSENSCNGKIQIQANNKRESINDLIAVAIITLIKFICSIALKKALFYSVHGVHLGFNKLISNSS